MCCMICLESKMLVKFQPCGHMKLCVDCNNANKSIKKCLQCKKDITGKIQPKTGGIYSYGLDSFIVKV